MKTCLLLLTAVLIAPIAYAQDSTPIVAAIKTRLEAAELNLKARRELNDGVNLFMQMTDEQVAGIAAGTLDPATLIDLGPRVTTDE